LSRALAAGQPLETFAFGLETGVVSLLERGSDGSFPHGFLRFVQAKVDLRKEHVSVR
jgi:hypothetical protein